MSATILPISQRAAVLTEPNQFTFQDRMDFARWQCTGAIRRMVIDDGDPSAGPSGASFALVYLHGGPWARWGITRSGQRVITWDCQTGADVSATQTTAAALASLPAATALPRYHARPGRA